LQSSSRESKSRSSCGGWLEYLHRTLRAVEGNESGCITGPTCQWETLALQVGGWAQGWRPCSVKQLLLRDLKACKADANRQNLVSDQLTCPPVVDREWWNPTPGLVGSPPAPPPLSACNNKTSLGKTRKASPVTVWGLNKYGHARTLAVLWGPADANRLSQSVGNDYRCVWVTQGLRYSASPFLPPTTQPLPRYFLGATQRAGVNQRPLYDRTTFHALQPAKCRVRGESCNVNTEQVILCCLVGATAYLRGGGD
jgi:hypothetical protein